MSIETIDNKYAHIATRISLTYPFVGLCPVSSEPQPSSTITISYQAGAKLLEMKSLRTYIKSFAGENVYGVRDLEEAAQVIAQACAQVLGTQVVLSAHYELREGSMDVEVIVQPTDQDEHMA